MSVPLTTVRMSDSTLLLLAVLLPLVTGGRDLNQPSHLVQEDYYSDYNVYDQYQSCSDVQQQLDETQIVLKNVTDGLLDDLCGEDGPECKKVVVYSYANSAVRQPTRFGLFYLNGVNEHEDILVKYPSYYNIATKQYLFFMHEFGEWEYWHQYERWLIGPTHNKAYGGIMIRPYDPEKRCPFQIKWFRSASYYYDKPYPNIWSPEGNAWVEDNTIKVDCYHESDFPPFNCTKPDFPEQVCDRLNVTSDDRVLEYHKWTLGEYKVVDPGSKQAQGYLAPLYEKESPGDSPSFLYSHHPQGRVWLVGSTTATWALRLNMLSQAGRTMPQSCPTNTGTPWEYLQSVKGEDETWLKDMKLTVTCIS